MTTLSNGERQLLIAIKEALRRKKVPDEKTVQEIGENFYGDELEDWEQAAEALVTRGLARLLRGVYELTVQGEEQAQQAHSQSMSQGFSEGLLRHEESAAYSEFCERLYGKDLCQFNMMDMEQLQKLLELLELTNENRVLDLGCGIGTITEYISDRTRAHLTGIDFAPGTIERALERTEEKRDRLNYEVGDMNSLDMPADSFDTIIAIDTLYFVENLGNTVGQMKRIMRPDGQMGLFFSQKVEPEESKARLRARETDLGRVLSAHNLAFTSWDFTQNEHDHWRRSLELAEELKDAFEEEGNLNIYKTRMEEGRRLLKMSDQGRSSRFLYHVRL
jgi:ubiquinone/menaquinone biosynthesis C-methylase UbiE